jgi:acyl-CoA thioester hydrolase
VDEYSKTYEIRWSDLDANGHVNYSAYVNAAGDVRFRFFGEHGFSPDKFAQLGVGPVFTALHIEFLREVRMGETVSITFALSGLSPQGGRWKVHHDILKSNGKKAVDLDVEGVVLDLTLRKPVLPSADLLQIFHLIPRAKDFEAEMSRRGR